MSYRVWIAPRVSRAVASWNLPDAVLVEIYLRLNADLADNPARVLRRVRRPFNGLVYYFEMIDPDNRVCVHRCLFQVVYSQDEETVIVGRGMYGRTVG